MSRRRRRRSLQQSRPPVAPASAPAEEERVANSELRIGEANGQASTLTIRAASTDADVRSIHAFLCVAATRAGTLHCPINPIKSIGEVHRLVAGRDAGFVLMAEENGVLVGTLGAVWVDWWYGDDHFFSDRWFFTVAGRPDVGAALMSEADAIAQEVGVPFILNLKQRRKSGTAVTYVRSTVLGG